MTVKPYLDFIEGAMRLMQDATLSAISLPESNQQAHDSHTIATLIGFLPEIHAIQLLTQNQWIDVPRSRTDLHTLWQKFKQRSSQPPTHNLPRIINVQSLPKQWQHYERELKSRETYLYWYSGITDYRLCCIPTAHLLTPQWYADLDYVQDLERQVPTPGDWEGILSFAFSEGTTWAEPLILALNETTASVAFRAPAANIHVPPFTLLPPQARQINALEYEISLRVQAKPNYLQVCRIQGNYVIVNGIHRILALWKAGWDSIPCLVRDAKQLQEVIPPNTLGFIHDIQYLQRPPYVQDFLNSDLAPRFLQRNVDYILRVLFQSDNIQVPRSA